MSDDRKDRPSVPMSEWIIEPVFDSAEYLKRSAMGEDELPGYVPAEDDDPNDLGGIDP